jgi:hypothetical protein
VAGRALPTALFNALLVEIRNALEVLFAGLPPVVFAIERVPGLFGA